MKKNNMSQIELARRTGIGQSTISRLESDLQPADEPQRLKLAEQLDIAPEELLGLPAPSFHIEHHQGGHSYNYNIGSNTDAVQAKDEVIAAKDGIIKVKDDLLEVQKRYIVELEEKVKALMK